MKKLLVLAFLASTLFTGCGETEESSRDISLTVNFSMLGMLIGGGLAVGAFIYAPENPNVTRKHLWRKIAIGASILIFFPSWITYVVLLNS